MLATPRNAFAKDNEREDLVTFDRVEPLYPAQSDVTLWYTLGAQVTANPLDWVGIFKSGSMDIDNPLTCQWAPVQQTSRTGTAGRYVVFPAKFIQPLADQPDSYHFLYVSGSSHILGSSRPFKVKDTGDLHQTTGTESTSAGAESHDRHSTNENVASYIAVSPELLTTDDEWELASHDELRETNSSTSDLSDIEILSTSPSKEAVEMKVSGVDEDDAVDDCGFEDIKTSSLTADDILDNCCRHPEHVTVAAEVMSSPQYQSIMRIDQQEPEVVEVKRRLSRHIKIGSEDEEHKSSEATVVKQSNTVKKVKRSNIASRNKARQLSKSEQIINAPISVPKLQRKSSRTVNSDSSSDNEEHSWTIHNCSVRNRKRKNNTEKNKSHPAVHHIPVTSESDPENEQQASVKKSKRRKRPKVTESVPPFCDRQSLRHQELSDCETAEAFIKLVRCEELVCHTRSDKEYAGRRTADQSLTIRSNRLRDLDENKTQVGHSPEESKNISRKTKRAGENIKYEDILCYEECAVSPEIISRKKFDESRNYEIISLSPQGVEVQKKTAGHVQTTANLDENRKVKIIPVSTVELKSPEKLVAHSRTVDENRRYKVIPRTIEELSPENIMSHSKTVNENRRYKVIPRTIEELSPENIMSHSKTVDENRKYKVIPRNIEGFTFPENKMSHSRTVDENRKYKVIPLSIEELTSPEKLMSHSKTVDENRKYTVIPGSNEDFTSPENVISHSRPIDENRKYTVIPRSNEDFTSPENVISHSRPIDENRKYTVIPPDIEDFTSPEKLISHSTPVDENRKYKVIPRNIEGFTFPENKMSHSRTVDENRKYKVIPLSIEELTPPEKLMSHSKVAKHGDEFRKNDTISRIVPTSVSLEEGNDQSMINVEENKRQDVGTCTLHIFGSSQQFQTNSRAMEDSHGKKQDDITNCNLQDLGLRKKTRTKTTSTRNIDDSRKLDDIHYRWQDVESPKKAKPYTKTSSNPDRQLKATTALHEQQMAELPEISKRKLVSETEFSKLGERGCRIVEFPGVGTEHVVGDGRYEGDMQDFSDEYVWEISSRGTVASKAPDDCLETRRKKCLRKDKSRTKNELFTKRQPDKACEAVVASGCRQVEADCLEVSQQHHTSCPQELQQRVSSHTKPSLEVADTEVWLPGDAGKQDSSSHSRELAETGLNVGRHGVMCASSVTGSGEKSIFEVSEEPLCFLEPRDQVVDGLSVVDPELAGRQSRKEKVSSSKVIRLSQSSFKAKYKYKGRTSSCQQYLRRGDICKWRQLKRWLLVNKRRFKLVHGSSSSDDADCLAGVHIEECNKDSAGPEMMPTTGLCPRIPDVVQSTATEDGRLAADGRLTYACVVKGTNHGACPLNQGVQENSVIEIPSETSHAITHERTECLKKETEELAEQGERTKPLCYGCVMNGEVSSMQEIHECPGLTFESNPHKMAAEEEFTWDFQTGVSGNVSENVELLNQVDEMVETPHSGSDQMRDTFAASRYIGNVEIAPRTIEDMGTVTKLVGDIRVVQENVGPAHVGPPVEDGVVGDGIHFNWPLPSVFIRSSRLHANTETGNGCPLIVKKMVNNDIFSRPIPTVVLTSSWLADQYESIHVCPVTPKEVVANDQSLSWPFPVTIGTSSKYELVPSQAEEVPKDASQGGPETGQVLTSDDSASDDHTLTWPLPVRNIASKFKLRDIPGDQADAQGWNSCKEFLTRESVPHKQSVSRTSLDIFSFPSPIQSQMSIPRIRGFPNNSSEVDAAPGVASKQFNTELGHPVIRPQGEDTDLRLRVDVLEKQLENVNSLLIKQERQQDLRSGAYGDDVAASGCSRSGKFKSVKHKRLPKTKSQGRGGTGRLARSNVESVSVKSKTRRIYETHIAGLENQLNSLREALSNAARKPVKIQVTCKKLHVKIRDRNQGVNADRVTDGSVKVIVAQDESEIQESPSRVGDRGLIPETPLRMGDEDLAHESHSGVRGECRIQECPSRFGDRDFVNESLLRVGDKNSVHKSASGMGDSHLIQETTSRVQTETSGMAYQGLVPETVSRVQNHDLVQTDTSRMEYGDLIQEALSGVGDVLQLIPLRVEDSHVGLTTPSRVGNPDLVKDTPSRMRNPDLIQANHSRVKDRKSEDSISGSKEETAAIRRTVGKLAALSTVHPGKLEKNDQQTVFRQCPHVHANQVSLAGMSETHILIPMNRYSAGLSPNKHNHPCSDCNCTLACDHAHAPRGNFHTNRLLPTSCVMSNKHQNAQMPTNTSGENIPLLASPSCDNHSLHISRPDSSRELPYCRFTSMEECARHENHHETCSHTLQPQRSCLRHRAPCCQHSRGCLAPQCHPSASQNHEVNSPINYPDPVYGSTPCFSKRAVQNPDYIISGDHAREVSSPWTSTIDQTFPKVCCWHSADHVGNELCSPQNHPSMFAAKYTERLVKDPAGSSVSCLCKDHRCLCHTADEHRQSSCVNSSHPDFFVIHHSPLKIPEERFPLQIPSLSPRVEFADSTGGDVDSRASCMWFQPTTPMNAPTYHAHLTSSQPIGEATECPASCRHTESHASIIPCSNSGRLSSNSHLHSCCQKLQVKDQRSNQKRMLSQKKLRKPLEHQAYLQTKHCYNPLSHKQHLVSAVHDLKPSCHFQAWEAPHALHNSHYLNAPLRCEVQHPYTQFPSRMCSLSHPYHSFLEEGSTANVMCDHIYMNKACLSSISSTDNSEERFKEHQHHRQQPDPTVEELNSAAETEYLASHREHCSHFCVFDRKRQIEGSQACHQRQQS